MFLETGIDSLLKFGWGGGGGSFQVRGQNFSLDWGGGELTLRLCIIYV
jgi:hypothetical protein